MKNKMAFCLLLYGTVLLLGGLLGHIKASRASWVAGIISALCVLAASFFSYRGKRWGSFLGLFFTFFLLVFFLYRYRLTFKFWPPGFMSLFSISVLIFPMMEKRFKKEKEPL